MKNAIVLFSLIFLCSNLSFGQRLGHSSLSPYAGSVEQNSHTIYQNIGETLNSRVDLTDVTMMDGLLHNISVGQFADSYIHVKFFYDKNEDGVKDSGEELLRQGAFTIDGGDIITNFDTQGIILSAISGTYSIEYNSIGAGDWVLTTQEEYEIELDENNKFATVEYGLYREPMPNISIKMVSDPFRCYYPVDYRACVMNIGTVTETGIFWLQMDPRFENIWYNWEPDHMIDSTFVGWDMVINPGQLIVYKYGIIAPEVTDESQIGVSYYTLASTDTDYGITQESLVQELGCSYDPNDKLVSPNRPDSLGLIDEPISYTIRFQNTGNAYAENVVVRDTISDDLDMNTFRVIDSSHPDVLSVVHNPDNNHIVNFRFDNIFLPDSTENYAGSNGFVLYQISAKDGTSINTEINNTGHIYFDFNPAIVTNTTSTTLVDTFPVIVAVEDYVFEEEVSIFPNPTKGLIQFDKMVDAVIVRDLYGRIVATELRTKKMNLSKLPSATYFLEILIDERRLVEKVILMD